MALSEFEKLVMSGSYVQVRYDAKYGTFSILWFLDTDVHMSLSKLWSDQLSRDSHLDLIQKIARDMNEEIMQFDMESDVRRSNHANTPGDHPQGPDAKSV
jgi:hypothetical protein